jgi:hypothetical protein
MGGLKTISIIVAANIKGLEQGLGKANKSLAKFASGAARMGSLLSFGVTAPLTALGSSALKTFVAFENGMTKVGTVTGATVGELKMLTDEAKRLGATTQFTASQVGDLQLVLGRKGFDPSAIKEMQGSILDLALATGEDLTLAAKVTSSTMKAFGLETAEAARVANTLASASANSSLQLSTFSTAFANAGASAAAVGVDVEELSAMMGTLMDSGIKASKAGTSLNSLFIQLKEKGISLTDTLDTLSEGELTLERATNLVGKNFSKQLLILAKNRDRTKELTEEYRNNTGRLKEMAEAMGNTTHAKLKRMESATEAMKLEFGALIAEAITPIIQWVTKMATSFANLDEGTKKIILGVGTLLAVLGPLLLIVATVTSAWGVMAGVIAALTSPIGLAIAAIAALPIALKYVLDNWDAFAERLGDWSWWRNALIQVLQWLFKYNPFSLILKGAQKLYDFLGVKSKVYNPFEDLVDGLEDLKVETTDYKHEFGSLTDSIKDGLKNLDIDLGSVFKSPTNTPQLDKPSQETRSLQEAYDAIFGQGAWEAFEEDKRKKQENVANTQRWSNSVQSASIGIATSFADTFATMAMSGELTMQSLGQIFVDLAKQIVGMTIKAAILVGVLQMTGLGAAAQAGGGIFSGGTGFKDILGGIMGGAFADGGNPPVGKMSLVGERGPELFVPKGQGTIIPNHALGGGGGTIIPDVRISGNDLLIVFDRAERRRNRR